MTPQHKANELVESYRILLQDTDTDISNEILLTTVAKQCALIAVDEIINATATWERRRIKSKNTRSGVEEIVVEIKDEYWQNVKTEIEKL